jgi:hypothetical protein
VFSASIGPAERKGFWLIYGEEKNGKTWLSLRLAKDLAACEKVSYISAEEGTDDSFVQACKRAGITRADKILIDEYLPFEDIVAKFKKPRTSNIIFIDNLTRYVGDVKSKDILYLMNELPHKLFVFIAHEDRNKPYPASARQAMKFAKVYINVKGLKAFVVSRFASQQGEIVINEELSAMYWGAEQEEEL